MNYTGNMTNQSGATMNNPLVVLTGYDGSGNVVLADAQPAQTNGQGTLARDAVATYILMEPLDRASLVNSTAFLAEGSY